MNVFASVHFFRGAFIAAAYLASGYITILAGEATPGEPPLIITRGIMTGYTLNGQPMRANLRNLVDEVMRRYSPATVNIVGVNEVTIDELMLRWPKPGRDRTDPAVNGILNTLAAATENRKFVVSHFGENEFLIAPPRPEPSQSIRLIEVFSLKKYLEGGSERDKRGLENQLRSLEMDLSAVRTQQGKDPMEQKNQIARLENQIQFLTAELKRMTRSKEESAKRIDQMLEVVNLALSKYSRGEKAPEFEYHPGTHLLIVIGSDSAIEVTRKVVMAMEKSSD